MTYRCEHCYKLEILNFTCYDCSKKLCRDHISSHKHDCQKKIINYCEEGLCINEFKNICKSCKKKYCFDHYQLHKCKTKKWCCWF